MPRIAALGLLLFALAVPSLAVAQSGPDAATPASKTETKPFGSHAAHDTQPPPAAQKRWHDLSGLPPPELIEGLGDHSYSIKTSSKEAQKYFDQGLIQAYGFNHLEALRAFRHAQTLDPDCAMCFWGEAYVLGPNLNLPMDEKALPLARAAAGNAQERAAKATPKEQALAAAMVARYEGQGERAALDRKYADAMVKVAEQFPDDPDVATLAAESLMLLSPWDYWSDNGRKAKEHTPKAVRLLEKALLKNPDHIAAIHFYIHLVEASDNPQRAEPYADRLRGTVPAAGHLTHMPSHIYLRLGRYKDTLAVNKDATASDERYIAANPKVQGPYPAMYFPHNVHFYMTAALMAGQGDAALAAAEKLAGLIPDKEAEAIVPAQPIKQAPYFIHAQFSDPDRILALLKPSEKLPFVVAGWHYARGVALALAGKPDEADAEANAIKKLADSDFSAFEQAAIPAKGILAIAENVVHAKAAMARGDRVNAKAYAEAAVKAQDALPYMEPPYWYVPVNQTLGAILLRSGEPHAATEAFKQACAKAPNSAWALFGLMRAQIASGHSEDAAKTEKRLEEALAGGTQEPSLDRM
ncbi:MAG: tetratricopeptide repeat protein [Xanthobacteraceae bacterium]